MIVRTHILLLAMAVGIAGCVVPKSEPSQPGQATVCRAHTDRHLLQIDVGSKTYCRPIHRARATTIDDGGVTRTVVLIATLVDREIVEQPTAQRYKLYATDGFTHGGYATWDNLRHGYIELATRKVVFAESQKLPHSFRIKDVYRIEVLPPQP